MNYFYDYLYFYFYYLMKTLEKRLPSKYYTKLTKKEKPKQLKELKKSRDLYKKGIYYTRKKMPSFVSLTSPHIKKFEKKYKVKITDLKAVSKATNVPIKALEKIVNKGMGAYYSSGSRPNQNPWSWGYARLASVLTRGNAYKIDKHVLDEYDIKEIKKGGSTIKCSKITNKTMKKYKSCIRNKDKKIFKLPRRFQPSKCKNPRGFTMKSSCAPFII